MLRKVRSELCEEHDIWLNVHSRIVTAALSRSVRVLAVPGTKCITDSMILEIVIE